MTAARPLRAAPPAANVPARPVTIAIAGNPNSGKSTLVNGLAGSRLQVGNWPGVTVERKEASFEHGGRRIRLVDLPGTYSLSPWSQEERVARDYLVEERPDVVVNVVDATNLERNLYLTVQLLELGLPVVMALNIYDEALAKGLRIDVRGLEERLGVPVIPTSATRKEGLPALLDAVLATADATDRPHRAGGRPSYGPDLEDAIAAVERAVEQADPALSASVPRRWLAVKLIEGDAPVAAATGLDAPALVDGPLRHLREAHGGDTEALVAEARYAVATGLTREVLTRPARPRRELTERIDRVVLNRFLGIPIFLAAMWLVFKLTFDLSAPFGDWIDAATNGPLKRWAAALLGAAGAPDWTVSLVNDGIVSGVGFVLVFVPVIFAMMFFITLLEASGYMARAAFVMDKAMHAIGLHGKSFIPMVLGFGCNVPAVYATRTLESHRDRVLTALLVPLMSCGARLPVYVLFVGVFFPDRPGTVIWGLYVLGIALAILVGMVFKRTLFRGEAPAFIMELPPYRMPSLRSLCLHTWEKGKHFLYKAGTYILAVSVIVWFLLNLPWGVASKKDSFLGQAGQAVAPALAPLGFGTWEAASSLITGIIAKEIVVGTMGEIYAPEAPSAPAGPAPTLAEDAKALATSFVAAVGSAGANVSSTFGLTSLRAEDDTAPDTPLKQAVHRAFTPLTALGFMIFVLLYMPCVVVAIAMRQELGGWRWFGLAFAYQTALAWGVALLVHQVGRALGLGA
ncbi:ferrous iron transport protein B [Anaeromyxobacter dehalogenans]|uniref:Ferrous iron transport protein B n=1 Tax=Anaeromyxobacter dehalogenans (strain 2CP-C) TaxID=290397 RepID=Q2IEQ2_ANADE|nr:ferrous iron transport protein B [Anaeromyxobacter dehalogenans]ABC83060.1 ferrous iron transport protein B [Anaeromyxobacter dehalogenans 2CP-C]